jgi:hypothetical protein
MLSKLELKPSILDQMEITKQWWKAMNTKEDPVLPVDTVQKWIVKNQLASDMEQASKVLVKLLGKVEMIEYEEFYKLFIKGIFRTALLDMLENIDELTKDQAELPLTLKLGAFRRNLLLAGLDKEESELKAKGKSILYAL